MPDLYGEEHPTFGRYETRAQCLSCMGSGKRPAQGGLKGGNYCRNCNGNGYTSNVYAIHQFVLWGERCYLCGEEEIDGMHELPQVRLV